jgi:exodeoxyribonuclease VII large subunit
VSNSKAFTERKIYRVAELTGLIREILEPRFSEVWVQGEISNFKRPSSGHLYFSLKDEKAHLKAVMFRFQNLYLRFEPEDGMEVICRGRISVYDQRGEYQLVVDQMQPVGLGALQVRFEQLKKRLEGEGLFDQAIKKPLPAYPERIAVITSPTGAALRDMIRVVTSRQALLDVLVIPSRVQGEGSAEELADALDLANQPWVSRPADRKPLEMIVLARGGGSLEDLWAFNEELLARAIFRSSLPVLSAVGHEIDFTIADFVADARAATPTAAAEIIVSARKDLYDKVQEFSERLARAILLEEERVDELLRWLSRSLPDPRRDIEGELLRLDDISWKLEKALGRGMTSFENRLQGLERNLSMLHPQVRYREAAFCLEKMTGSLGRTVSGKLETETKRLEYHAGRLDALSPLATLSRGYSIARTKDAKKIIRDAGDTEMGDLLELILARGSLECEVKGKSEKPGSSQVNK